MTTQADEVFKKILEHYSELQSLIKVDEDRDAFQDTILWMAEHPRVDGYFVRRFKNRFHYIRIENYSPFALLTREVEDPSEPYEEKTSDEHVDSVLEELYNAIFTEKEKDIPGKRRRKKKR